MILGIDPGLTTFGWARISDRAEVLDVGLLEQKPGKTKNHAGRAHRQAATFIALLADVRLVVAEALSFPRGIGGVASCCLSWGVLVGACAARSIPLVGVSPQRWQHAVLGVQGGAVEYSTLVALIEAHVQQHAAPAARRSLAAITPSKRSHPLDAVGAGLYGAVTPNLQPVTAPRPSPATKRRTRRKGRA